MGVSGGLPTVWNINIPLKNTEYKISFPSETKKFLVQSRSGSDLKISFAEGQSGITYFTLRGFSTYYEDQVLGPFICYVQAADDNSTIEVVCWGAKD